MKGLQRDPLLDIEVDGRTCVRRLSAIRGAAVNIVLHPGLVRREVAGPLGICLETIVAAPSLPFVAVQWSAAGAGTPSEMTFEVPGEVAQLEADAEAGVVRRVHDGSHSVVAGLVGDAGSRRVDLSRGAPGWTTVHWTGLSGSPLTLVVAAGNPAEVRSALAASGHLQGHANRAAQSPVHEGLTLSTGVEEIDDGVAWAIARVHAEADLASVSPSAVAPAVGVTEPLHRLLIGLAAIAAGDVEGAEGLLRAGEGIGDTVHGLLSATSALATGRSGPAGRVAQAWLGTDAPPADHGLGLTDAAYGRLADALRHGAPDDVIAGLRRSVGRGQPAAGPAGRLPMVGQSRGTSPGWGPWITSVLSGDPGGDAPASPRTDVLIARRSCADFARDPDAAWAAWRQLLASGIRGGRLAEWDLDPAAPASGAHVEPFDGVPPEIVLALVHGLLGYSPDAPVGRLRLAPRIPSHLTRFTVTGLGVGEASLTLEYERAAGMHRFTLDPVLAAVPPLAVFEPAVEGSVLGVRVDGSSAELDTRPAGVRTVVPVQIPVDAPRTIEIEVTTGENR